MKADDRLMVILTAVVLVVAVGTMAQRSEFIMAAFGSVDEYEAVDDAFTVRAGRTQPLDVLSNDINAQEGDSDRILIVQQPVCGTARRSGGRIDYLNSDACSGRMVFTYCVIQGDTCPSAEVVLNVSLPEAMPGRDGAAIADAGSTGFPTLRAPSLATPDSNVGIAPADATASIRNRDIQPVQIGRPADSAGVGIAPQQSAAISIGGAGVSGGFGASAPSVDSGLPTLSRGDAPERVTIARAPTPQLGSVGRDFASTTPPSSPRPSGLASPSAPSMAGLRSPGASAPAPRPGVPSQPQVAEVDTDSGVTSQRSAGRLTLRSVTTMFRPVGTSADDTSPTVTAQASARPRVNLTPGLQGSAVVTERAAQIIVPVATETTSVRSGSSPQAPSMPVEQSIASLGGTASPQAPSIGSTAPVRSASLGSVEPQLPVVDATPQIAVPADVQCNANLVSSSKLGEMLALTVTSECRPNSLLTLSYSGLSFTAVTGPSGSLQIDVPAFDEDTTIVAEFLDGTTAQSEITVRGIDRVARVGIAWEGEANLDLHAFEYTAAEGSEGHIWEGNERSYRESRRNGGGYLTRLGLPGARQVEVYTLPVSRRTQAGVIDTQIRFTNDAELCDDRIQVLSLYNNQTLTSDQRSVSIETAQCGTGGDVISIDSAVRSISVAGR
ncbi:hypothetical protein SAMN06273572_101639 [Monaibacterium marinum]|uniref:Uncharacterized protein n=1 Tax=Pontivivens marinum TaxID=1690039 RepID=A0A2C9CNL5_9RHOB|nr:hypothetical protein [Monaibacterium marinum]SOH92790.1 hypothetical protein SAMN06273572_101639 [Monaibacterium marinum]